MCGRPPHIVFILRPTGIKHEYEINIGAGSILSILVSRDKGADKICCDKGSSYILRL